jgi:hypothetical protein
VEVRFKGDYVGYSGYYPVGATINLDVSTGNDVVAQIKGVADNGFYQSREQTQQINVYRSSGSIDYLFANLWVLLVAYAAVMSYRLFSGRSLDFKDMWDEFHGRK